ncbi:MAG TPA: T9SS type A sorting domain-containing protein [Bacteroidia bacterium]|nr:T9SS type A sorting domain-containing protein [Bacteroidia bacterium]
MKKLFFTFSLLFIAFIGRSQVSPTENFEVLADSVYNDTLTGNVSWATTNLVANSGVQSYTSPVTVTQNGARTIEFSTVPNTFVTLSFWHICRIDFQDFATLEYSVDGATWFQIDGSSMDPASCTYLTFAQSGNNFWSSASNLSWDPATPGTPANNTMWCKETFDLSNLIANFPTAYIRWTLTDGNGDGSGGYPGWYIDDINITQAACELVPPTHTVGNLLSGTVYSLGPYTLTDSITDNSGIANANIVYTINGVLQPVVPMAIVQGNIWQGTIPAVSDSDTICYYFEATDASACSNYSRYPDPNAQCFVATTGIGFPFCDNFDSQNLWANTTVAGSAWDLGTPTSNPSAALSPPNVWEVALNNQYLNNTETYLNLTQSISFNGITNAYVEFWFYSDCENSWDGTRLEYRTAANPTWRVLGSTTSGGTNWYNDAALNSSNLPAWTGNGTTGAGTSAWTKAKHTLPNDIYGDQAVEFQFVFTSDGSVVDNGFAIDGFCLIVPPPNDAAIVQVTSPAGQYPADSCATVTVNISNEGTLTLTSIPITYVNQVTGHTVTETWTGTLAPNATATFSFAACDTVVAGNSCLQIYTDLPGDGNNFNDTAVVCPFGIPTFNVTACDDFESGATGWLGNGQWQLGTPAFGATTGAHSGVNAWDINLTGPYTNGVTDTLYSPFYNVAGVVNPYLRFWQNRNTEVEIAGFWIEYSVNGAGWQTLGSTTSGSNATNWYNQTSVAFGGNGWDGNSGGWVKSTFSLSSVFPPNANTVRFRIVWDAAFGNPIEGVSIDDFCVVAPPPIDAGVVAITAPSGQLPAGDCVPVTVTIKNFGTTTLNTVPVTYISGAQTGTATYSGSLAPNATATVTISTPCLTVPVGPYTICAVTGATGDGDSSNDTTCIDLIGIEVLNPSSCLDFEANNGSWTPANGGNTSLWEWGAPAFGATTGGHNSTNAWDVSLTAPYINGMNDTLYTTYYNVVGAINPYLSFWQNRNTFSGDDGFWLEYTVNNGNNWQSLPSGLNGLSWYNQPNLDGLNEQAWDGNSGGWVKSTYFLSNALAGVDKVRFRFIFHSTAFGTPLDGVSIDDFCVNLPPADDAGVISVVSASGAVLPQGNTDSVRIDVRNFGINTITSVGVTYSVEQGGTTLFTSNTVNWSGTLLSNGTFGTTVGLLTHPDTYVVPTGAYEICAWTTLTGDGDATNDTSCTNGVGVPVIAIDYNTSYCDDFEGPNAGWTATVDPTGNPGTIWELGQPNFGVTTGAYSGANAWDLNLNSAYTDGANCILTSPIFDFSNAVDTKLSFWRNHETENSFDGTRLEFRVGGNPWEVLGTNTSVPPVALNWYNDNLITSSGLPGWTGASGGWSNSIWYKLDSYNNNIFNNAPTVQFRYIFTSDGIVTDDGFSIDDFCLEVPVPLTSTPTSVGSTNVPAALIFPGQCITFKSLLKNDGTTPLNTMVATLQIDGTTYVSDVVGYPTPLASGASQVHNFSNCWSAVPGTHNICVITSLPNNSADLKPSGDTICYSITVLDSVDVSQTTYCNDFENPLLPEWLTLNSVTYNTTKTSWKKGNPNKPPFITGTHSGANCWATALDSLQYENRDTSALFTPVFRIVPGLPYNFEFWGNFDSERNEDGGTVEYSTDYAATWETLGNERDSVWMNTYNITALGSVPPVRPGWSGSSGNQWERRKHYLCVSNPLVSQVIFRFRFASDFSIRGAGWAVDDVCFKLDLSMPLCVVGVDNIDEELGFSLEQNIPNPFNNQTIINYNLLKPGKTSLVITNIMGQVVDIPVNDRMLPGTHSVTIDGNKLSAGVYYYTLNFEGKKLTKKMVITE